MKNAAFIDVLKNEFAVRSSVRSSIMNLFVMLTKYL